MKAFVAGATGVLGSRVVPLLVADGHEVTALARSDDKARALEKAGACPSRVSIFEPGPLAEAIAGHDAVLNLATHIPRTSRAALPGVWKQNDRLRREGSRNLVDGALGADASVYIQESIVFVYSDAGQQWIDESGDVDLVPYTQSACDALTSTERFSDAGRRGIFLRFAMFYADDAHHSLDYLTWARRGFSLEPGDPAAFKSMVHADDAASAVVSALGAPAGLYNVGDDEPLPRRDHDQVLASIVGRSGLKRTIAKLSALGGRKVEILKRSQRISNRRFKETTGWAPRYRSIREGWPAVAQQIERNASHA